ncbi:hypothetical protein AB0E27_34110 [Streptomyces sparsogenes]|uniref:hypothetical protein n=1 Tax=Streptomyces sparsogenes TaxID=67365 RepID=UPI0033C8B710
MTTPATPPPPQGQDDDGPQGQDGDDRPTLEELRQRCAALSELITQHLGRGPK